MQEERQIHTGIHDEGRRANMSKIKKRNLANEEVKYLSQP